MKKLLIVISVILIFVIPGKSQCDLKLKDKVSEEIKQDGYALIKDLNFELDESGSTECRLVLSKTFPYRFYLGLSEKYPSEVDFYITTYGGKDTVTGLTLDKEMMTLDFHPTTSGVYEINTRLKRGTKSCGVILLSFKGNGSIKPASAVKIPVDTTRAYLVVDEMPQFIEGGSLQAFNDWLKSNLSYPEIAKKKGIQGKVYIQFIVNYAGNVDKVNVLRGLDPEVDAYVVNLIKSCPKWQKPGILQNKAVSVLFTLPVVIKENK